MNVILLHGLYTNSWFMRPLGQYLAQHSFRPLYFDYATTRATPRDHAHALLQKISANQWENSHFIAHSLGGLVLRHLGDIAPDVIQKAVITIGTPHQGSAVARAIHQRCPSLLGRAWDLGLNGDVPAWKLDVPFGNVVGVSSHGVGKWFCDLPAPHDGTVAMAETVLPNSHVLQLACGHTALLFDKQLAAQSAYFLQHHCWQDS